MAQLEENSEQQKENLPPTNNKADGIFRYPYRSSSDYAAAVNQWLWQCYHWQCFNYTFPYYVSLSASSSIPPVGATPDLNRNFPPNFLSHQHAPAQHSINPNLGPGVEFYVPSLWRRFAAELIDFFILLMLKVMITYVALDFFDIIDTEKYDLDLLRNDKIDYRKAVEVTSEIIALEIIHRFAVCIFEAICMHKGVIGNGGATPGKCVMKIKVVACRTAVTIDANKVRVYPAGEMGFGWALLRAFIKNFSLAFVFPICFTMFFFKHNRTAYDIICNSIVVEDPVWRFENRGQRNNN